jgi:hypothetical protein
MNEQHLDSIERIHPPILFMYPAILFILLTAQPVNCHSERRKEFRMPRTRTIGHGWADLGNGTSPCQGFLGWRLEMTVA